MYLKTTANLSQGGSATDVTDEVSPDIRLMAERTARIIGLDCVGVDALALDRACGNILLFSIDPSNQKLGEHIKKGGTVVTVEKRNVVIRNRELDIIVCALETIPITFGGIVDFNISNALAAVGALYGLNLPVEQIRNGIMTFYPSTNQNPGRMNLLDFQKFKELVDYGHNTDSARAMATLLPRLSPGRKVALCHGTGSRTNEQIIEYGKALTSVFDYILLADLAPRNRPMGKTIGLVREGLIKGGFKKENIEIVPEPEKAVDYLFSKAETGDLLVIHPDELEPILSQVMERYRQIVTLI